MAFGSGIMVKMGLDSDQFNRRMKESRGRVLAFGKQVAGAFMAVGTAIAGALAVGGVRNLFNEFDRVGKLASQMGVLPETIQRIGLVAEMAGANAEIFTKGLLQARRFAEEAANGNKAYADSFARLNLDAQEFLNAPLEQNLIMLNEAFNRAQESGSGVADVMKLLGGRGGKEMLVALRMESGALAKQLDEVDTVSGKTVRRVEELNDEMTKVANKVKVAVLPPIVAFINFLIEASKALNIFGKIGSAALDPVTQSLDSFFQLISKNATAAIDSFKALGKAITGDFAGAMKIAEDIDMVSLDDIKDKLADIGKAGELAAEDIKKLLAELAQIDTAGALADIFKGDQQMPETPQAPSSTDGLDTDEDFDGSTQDSNEITGSAKYVVDNFMRGLDNTNVLLDQIIAEAINIAEEVRKQGTAGGPGSQSSAKGRGASETGPTQGTGEGARALRGWEPREDRSLADLTREELAEDLFKGPGAPESQMNAPRKDMQEQENLRDPLDEAVSLLTSIDTKVQQWPANR